MTASRKRRCSPAKLKWLAILAACAAFFLWLVPSNVSAQERLLPDQEARQDELDATARALLSADFRLGPLYFQPQVSFGAGMQSVPVRRVDSLQRELEPDFRTIVAPMLRIAVPLREHSVSADGRVDYVWYNKFDELSAFNFGASGRYDFVSQRFLIALRNDYFNAVQGYLDPIVGPDGTPVAPPYEIDERVRLETNTVQGSLRWLLTQRNFVSFGIGRSIFRYDDDARGTGGTANELDRTEEFWSVSAGHQILPKTSISGSYGWRDYAYEMVGSIRDAVARTASVAAEFDPAAVISGSMWGGYEWLIPTHPEAVGYLGPIGGARISIRPGTSSILDLTAGRNTFPSLWFDSLFAIRDGGSASIRFGANRKLRFGGSVSIHKHLYPTEVTAPQLDGELLTAKRYDYIVRFGGQVQWFFLGNSGATLDIGHFRRDSNFDLIDLDGMTVSVGYTISR